MCMIACLKKERQVVGCGRPGLRKSLFGKAHNLLSKLLYEGLSTRLLVAEGEARSVLLGLKTKESYASCYIIESAFS